MVTNICHDISPGAGLSHREFILSLVNNILQKAELKVQWHAYENKYLSLTQPKDLQVRPAALYFDC